LPPPVRQPGARNAVLRLFHSAQWLFVAAIIISAALVVDPQLRNNANIHIAASAWLLAALVFARLRWPVKDESARLFSGIVLIQIGVAVVLWYEAPALNGLLVAFVLFTTTAWLLLERGRALAVMLLTFAISVVVISSSSPSVSDWLYLAALCSGIAASARIAEVAVRTAVRAQTQIVARSGRDELTRLPGRMAFLRDAEAIHDRATETRVPYAIELVDINNLRAINDTYGYAAGDRAIVLVAEALQRLREPSEYLARYDGDKFILLVPKLEGDRADDLARRIRSVVFSTTFAADMEVVRIKANVGIARYPLAGVTLNALISAAERDMELDQRGRIPPDKKPVFRRRSGKLSA
jgi:diguanylate cyclase (GGDEF)-like protein